MNKEDIKKIKASYEEIIVMCEKHKYLSDMHPSDFGDVKKLEMSAKGHLMLIDWFEKYGIDISHNVNPCDGNYINIGYYRNISYFRDAKCEKEQGHGKFISWSDDGRQPMNEWLYSIGFSTGAYIFGDDYQGQRQIFQDFFDELKSYNPDYADTANHHLYWKLENSKKIFKEFNGILKKYEKKCQNERKQMEANKLREELAKLEKSND